LPLGSERCGARGLSLNSSSGLISTIKKIGAEVERFERARRQVTIVDADSWLAVNGAGDPLLRRNLTHRAAPATKVEIAELFRDNRSRLIGLSTAILLDRELAEEVVQDAFEGLQRNADRVDNAVGYLQRSVVNLSVSTIRRRRVAARHPTPPALPASMPEIGEAWAAVVRLAPKQRAVVVLRFWHDQSIETIAETLGWPAGSVKSTLHRALKQLERELK
jgi:DNA-directed RNA polymerase specialized sigma24 family protein